VHVLEGTGSTTTVAAGVTRAGEDDLRGHNDIRTSSISHDLDSVGEGGSGTKGVAATTVLRNVMVSDDGEVVLAVDVVPEEVLGNLAFGLVSSRVDDVLDDLLGVVVDELLHREQR